MNKMSTLQLLLFSIFNFAFFQNSRALNQIENGGGDDLLPRLEKSKRTKGGLEAGTSAVGKIDEEPVYSDVQYNLYDEQGNLLIGQGSGAPFEGSNYGEMTNVGTAGKVTCYPPPSSSLMLPVILIFCRLRGNS